MMDILQLLRLNTLILCLLIFAIKANSQAIPVVNPKLGPKPTISKRNQVRLAKKLKIKTRLDSLWSQCGYTNKQPEQCFSKKELKFHEENVMMYDNVWDISPLGCNWYEGGGPDSIVSTDKIIAKADTTPFTHNIFDFSLKTAWIDSIDNNKVSSISFRFPPHSATLTTIEIYNGNLCSEAAWKKYSRVKGMKLFVNDTPVAILNIKDLKSCQIFNIGNIHVFGRETWLKFEITDTYRGSKYNSFAISEIGFDGTGVHCFAVGTKIHMAGDSLKNIENLRIGDRIMSYNSSTKQFEIGKVLQLTSAMHSNLYEYKFKGHTVRATDDHPFYYKGNFYSLLPNVSNRNYELNCKQLTFGDSISSYQNGRLKALKLISIKRIDKKLKAYTILALDKGNVFFVNGIAVGTEPDKKTQPASAEKEVK